MSVSELLNLRGRFALITGAGGHIGREMAITLAELGANLFLVDRKEVNLDSFSKSLISDYEIRVEVIPCDLESEPERNGLIKDVKSHGCLNILVNNAAFVGSSGLEGWATPFEEQSVETWRRAIEVNLTSVFHLSRDFATVLKGSEGASIINIASIYGALGPDYSLYEGTQMQNPAAYGASKGGLIQFTKWLATTLAPDVRVNAISPGGVLRGQPNSFVQRYKKKTPLGRMAKEKDFQGTLAYLASDMSSYVTGQNIFVDGGFNIW